MARDSIVDRTNGIVEAKGYVDSDTVESGEPHPSHDLSTLGNDDVAYCRRCGYWVLGIRCSKLRLLTLECCPLKATNVKHLRLLNLGITPHPIACLFHCQYPTHQTYIAMLKTKLTKLTIQITSVWHLHNHIITSGCVVNWTLLFGIVAILPEFLLGTRKMIIRILFTLDFFA